MWRNCRIFFAICLTNVQTFSQLGYWKPLKIFPLSGCLVKRSCSLFIPSEIIIPVLVSITTAIPPHWKLSTNPSFLPNLPPAVKIWTTLCISRIVFIRIVLTVSGQNSFKDSCWVITSSKRSFFFRHVLKKSFKSSIESLFMIWAPLPKEPLKGLEKKRGFFSIKALNSSKVQMRASKYSRWIKLAKILKLLTLFPAKILWAGLLLSVK